MICDGLNLLSRHFFDWNSYQSLFIGQNQRHRVIVFKVFYLHSHLVHKFRWSEFFMRWNFPNTSILGCENFCLLLTLLYFRALEKVFNQISFTLIGNISGLLSLITATTQTSDKEKKFCVAFVIVFIAYRNFNINNIIHPCFSNWEKMTEKKLIRVKLVLEAFRNISYIITKSVGLGIWG